MSGKGSNLLVAHEDDIEVWLQQEVLPTLDRIKSGMTYILTAEEAWAELQAYTAASFPPLAGGKAISTS